MATPCAQIDMNDISFAPKPEPNRNGGKYVSISHQGEHMVNILLGDESTFSRVAFAPEQDKTKPEKWTMKIEVGGAREAFVRGIEAKAVQAAVANGWFKKGLFEPSADAVKSQINSTLKESAKAEYPDPSFKMHCPPEVTDVMIAPSMDALHEAQPGTIHDITQGMLVLPVIRTKGGVWFSGSSFGLACEATNLLVVKKTARGSKRKLTGLAAFNLGGGGGNSGGCGSAPGSSCSDAGEPRSP